MNTSSTPGIVGTPVSGFSIEPYSLSTLSASVGISPPVTVWYLIPIDLSWFSTPLFAAGPTRNASMLLSRDMPVSPSRFSSLSVMSGMPLFVT
jgi:hypothetical protein